MYIYIGKNGKFAFNKENIAFIQLKGCKIYFYFINKEALSVDLNSEKEAEEEFDYMMDKMK